MAQLSRRLLYPLSRAFEHFRNGIDHRIPSLCRFCEQWSQDPVCTSCLANHAPPASRCQHCALPLTRYQTVCGECALSRQRLNRCYCAVDYIAPWSQAIAQFKFHGNLSWARFFAQQWAQNPALLSTWQACDIAAPIPLTPNKLRHRGFNQSWCLLEALNQCIQVKTRAQSPQPKLIPDLLLRLFDGPDQHALNQHERLTNLKHTFAINPIYLKPLQGAHVLLIDDVMTTGTTLLRTSQCLMRAGASTVSAIVIARA